MTREKRGGKKGKIIFLSGRKGGNFTEGKMPLRLTLNRRNWRLKHAGSTTDDLIQNMLKCHAWQRNNLSVSRESRAAKEPGSVNRCEKLVLIIGRGRGKWHSQLFAVFWLC